MSTGKSCKLTILVTRDEEPVFVLQARDKLADSKQAINHRIIVSQDSTSAEDSSPGDNQ